jgi:hypothetical protein
LETEAKREEFFRKCAEVGVKGVKIDFMNSESHERLEFYQDCLRKGAKYKIAINFHGANKPAGESRTWPNEVTREGIKGLEHNIHNTVTPEHYSTLPFTRLLAGHGDFTHTTFQPERLKDTTPGMQMATPVLFTSAVQHWADKGEIYLNSPAVNMIRSMPTVWDETHVLPGSKIGEVAKFARRNGKVWYLAVANSKADRDYEIKLDFLGKGKYLADVVRDDPADRNGMIAEEITVSARDTFSCKLLRGGGLCIRFAKVRMKPFGDGFSGTLDVSIARATNCDLRYTLDGSEPTNKSAKLVGDSLTIEERCRLRLKIIKGDGKGTDLEADFIKVPLAAPIMKSSALIWADNKVELAMDDGMPGASIFYTTDGSSPNDNSSRYAGPFEIKKDCVLKAIAVKGSEKSAVAEYTLTCPPKPDVELSSLIADSMTTGWAEVGINKSCQGNELRIAGHKFERGIGTHANSALLYSLKNEYKHFVALVGVDDEVVGDKSTVKFLIKIDGQQVASSPLMKVNDIWAFNVAIPENAQKLELISTDAGDGIHSDHTNWCDAGFLNPDFSGKP